MGWGRFGGIDGVGWDGVGRSRGWGGVWWGRVG